MAKVMNEQMRVPIQFDSPPIWSGDGAPMHSAIIHDMGRQLNNMQAYRSNGYFCVNDACQVSGVAGSPAGSRTQYVVDTVGGGDGQCLLMQVPIPVRVDAHHLVWSLGISRSHFPQEDPIQVNVNNIVMYLASEPVLSLHEYSPPQPENGRLFSEAFITGPFTKNVVAAAGAGANTPNPCYTLITSETWTNFAPRGVNNINDRDRDPWAWLLVTAEFSAGVTAEGIRACELSGWGAFE